MTKGAIWIGRESGARMIAQFPIQSRSSEDTTIHIGPDKAVLPIRLEPKLRVCLYGRLKASIAAKGFLPLIDEGKEIDIAAILRNAIGTDNISEFDPFNAASSITDENILT